MRNHLAFLRNHAEASAEIYIDDRGICRDRHNIHFNGLSLREVRVLLKAIQDDFDETQEIWAKHLAGSSLKKLSIEYGYSLGETKERLRWAEIRVNEPRKSIDILALPPVTESTDYHHSEV